MSANIFFHQICAHISPAEQVKYAQQMCTKMCVRNHTYAFERTREIAVRDPNRLTDDASSRSSVSGYPIFFGFFSSLTFSSPRRQQSKSQQSKSQQSKRNTTPSVKSSLNSNDHIIYEFTLAPGADSKRDSRNPNVVVGARLAA